MRESLCARPRSAVSMPAPVVRLLVAGAVATVLAGCTLGPNYERPKVPLPDAFRVPAGTSANAVDIAWWEGFHDPDLDALIKQAIDANKNLLEATARVQESEAQLKIAGADKYPHLDYDLSAERRRYSTNRPQAVGIVRQPNQNEFVAGFGAGWALDLWGRVRRANEAARAQLLASEYARRGVMLTVVTNVATAYFNLRALDQQLALARKTLKVREDALQLITTRFQGGSSSRLAALQAQSAVDEVSVKIPEIQRQIAAQENALSLLLGENPGRVVRSAGDAEPALPAVPAGVPSDVLGQRPDVLAAEQDLIAANARIGVAKAAFFPSISLTGLFGVASNDLGTLTNETSIDRSISASLLGPIFDGGRASGNVHLAEAAKRELVLKYEQAIQSALSDVDNALVFHAKANEVAARGRHQVKTLQDLAKLAELSYEGGQFDYLGVLTAERDLYRAQAEQVDRHRDQFLSLVSVYAAMGGGWMAAQDKLRATAAAGVSPAAGAAGGSAVPAPHGAHAAPSLDATIHPVSTSNEPSADRRGEES